MNYNIRNLILMIIVVKNNIECYEECVSILFCLIMTDSYNIL